MSLSFDRILSVTAGKMLELVVVVSPSNFSISKWLDKGWTIAGDHDEQYIAPIDRVAELATQWGNTRNQRKTGVD